jgi:enoyl-CoA hydratase/carnithine racemase
MIDVDREAGGEAGGVSVITLAGEARDGFLHTPALLRLAAVLRDAAVDPAVRVVVIRCRFPS